VAPTYTVLTVPEMAARCRRGVSTDTVYLRVERLHGFKALYRSGPIRFLLGPRGESRPRPHFNPRDRRTVSWASPLHGLERNTLNSRARAS
jgi:hypothetical protein